MSPTLSPCPFIAIGAISFSEGTNAEVAVTNAPGRAARYITLGKRVDLCTEQ
jgi:hypothetical protein